MPHPNDHLPQLRFMCKVSHTAYKLRYQQMGWHLLYLMYTSMLHVAPVFTYSTWRKTLDILNNKSSIHYCNLMFAMFVPVFVPMLVPVSTVSFN